MLAMLIISMVLVAVYVVAAGIRERQVPESISAMVYVLPEGGWRWLWSLWLAVVSVLTFAPAVFLLDARSIAFLGFLPMACLVFVAAWPLWDEGHRRWHYDVAIAGGLLSQACVALLGPWWLTTWGLWVLAFVWKTKDAPYREWRWPVFLSECICYMSTVGALLQAAS